jgi:hypothetical protein
MVEGGESITIFAGADGRKPKAKADYSPGSRRVRNDNVAGDLPGARVAGEGAVPRLAKEARRGAPTMEGVRTTQAFDRMSAKELGEFAEAEFLRTVLKMGMAVTKPWGENQGYDFIVDVKGRLTRVQVKAAFRQGRQGGYSFRTYRSSKECYTPKEIDALAGYVAPEEAWYLFPVRVVRRVRSLKLFPGSRRSGRSLSGGEKLGG